jgi:hypothetical protein
VEELLNIDGSHRAWCVDDAQLDFTMFDSVRSPSREMFSGIRLNIGGTSPLDAVYGDARPYFVITGGDRDTACR